MNYLLKNKDKVLISKACAKLNLFLNVVGRREDGYHLIESVFIPIEGLYDEISVTHSDAVECNVTGAALSGENIVLKVVQRLREEFKIDSGAKIGIQKRIPVSAGLGGGSSDAASTLKLLCKLWNIKMSNQQLIDFAVSIGADVPFFLDPKPSFVQGIGEIISPIKLKQRLVILLVNPGIAINTAEIFRMGFSKYSEKIAMSQSKDWYNSISQIKECKERGAMPIEIGEQRVDDAIFKNGDWYELIHYGTNDLQSNAIKAAPVIKELIDLLLSQNACIDAKMSGSGSTCFGIFTNIDAAEKAASNIPKGWFTHLHRHC